MCQSQIKLPRMKTSILSNNYQIQFYFRILKKKYLRLIINKIIKMKRKKIMKNLFKMKINKKNKN